MKKSILLVISLCFFTTLTMGQSKDDLLITFKIKNASVFPRKIALISYQPNEVGNGTSIFYIMPGFKKKLQFKIGTKIYIANNNQVGTVMSGKRIDNEEPFLVLKKHDNHKVFKL